MKSPKKRRPGGCKWKHGITADGPIVKDVEHVLVDQYDDTMDDIWGRLQCPGFRDHARQEAEQIVGEAISEPQGRDAIDVLSGISTMEAVLPPNSPIDRASSPWHDINMLADACVRLGRAYERMMCRYC